MQRDKEFLRNWAINNTPLEEINKTWQNFRCIGKKKKTLTKFVLGVAKESLYKIYAQHGT